MNPTQQAQNPTRRRVKPDAGQQPLPTAAAPVAADCGHGCTSDAVTAGCPTHDPQQPPLPPCDAVSDTGLPCARNRHSDTEAHQDQTGNVLWFTKDPETPCTLCKVTIKASQLSKHLADAHAGNQSPAADPAHGEAVAARLAAVAGDIEPPPAQRPPATAPPAITPPTVADTARQVIVAGWKLLLVGMPGVGKTLFGVGCPAPIFLACEDSSNVPASAKFKRDPSTWSDLMDAFKWLDEKIHKYQTLVLDTADAAQRMAVEHVKGKAAMRGEKTAWLSDVGGGYNKGKEATAEEWNTLLAWCDRLRNRRGMNVLINAHCDSVTRTNPDGPDYPAWQMIVDPKVAGLLIGWAEIVSFGFLEVRAGTVDGKKRGKAKGLSTGARKMRFMPSATAIWCKNRQGLPAELALDPSVFLAAYHNVKANRLDPSLVADLVADIQRAVLLLGDATFLDADGKSQKFMDYIAKELLAVPPPNVVRLQQLQSRLANQLEALGIDPDAEPAAVAPAPDGQPSFGS